MVILIGLLIAGIGVGLAVGIYVGSRGLSTRRTGATAAENLRLSEEAKRGAEAIRREAQVEAREEALKLRADVERELQEKRAEIMARAAEYAHNREVGGIHYASDVEMGKISGSVIAAVLLNRDYFNAEYDVSRAELRSDLGM